jgi:hypothetical protein
MVQLVVVAVPFRLFIFDVEAVSLLLLSRVVFSCVLAHAVCSRCSELYFCYQIPMKVLQ